SVMFQVGFVRNPTLIAGRPFLTTSNKILANGNMASPTQRIPRPYASLSLNLLKDGFDQASLSLNLLKDGFDQASLSLNLLKDGFDQASLSLNLLKDGFDQASLSLNLQEN